MVDKQLHKSNSSIKASLATQLASLARVNDRDDPYTLSDYGKELSNGTFTMAAAVGSLSTAGSLVVGGGSVGAVLAVAGTVAGLVGATELAAKIAKDKKDRG